MGSIFNGLKELKMKKYTEEELKQIFKNRSNCYADSDEVIMAMDEQRFIETLKELKILPRQRVSKRCFCGAAWDGITCNHCGFDASEVDIY